MAARNRWLMRPALHRGVNGSDLLLGPIQFNWYNRGFRVHMTWPVLRTVTLWQKETPVGR